MRPAPPPAALPFILREHAPPAGQTSIHLGLHKVNCLFWLGVKKTAGPQRNCEQTPVQNKNPFRSTAPRCHVDSDEGKAVQGNTAWKDPLGPAGTASLKRQLKSELLPGTRNAMGRIREVPGPLLPGPSFLAKE